MTHIHSPRATTFSPLRNHELLKEVVKLRHDFSKQECEHQNYAANLRYRLEKETQAAILRIKMRLSTYEEEIGRMGKDWRPVFQQIAREQGVLKDLEIEPEESNAMNAASGDIREAGDGGVDDKAQDERKKDA